MTELDFILSWLKAKNIPVKRDGFKSIPQERVFAVYRRSNRKLEGADGYGIYWDSNLEIVIYYGEARTEQDCEFEREFELQCLRALNAVTSEDGYNNKYGLAYTVYSFKAYNDIDDI